MLCLDSDFASFLLIHTCAHTHTHTHHTHTHTHTTHTHTHIHTQGVSGGIVNILGGGSMDYSE